MSDGTVYNLLKCTDMRIHAAADVRTTSGASPKSLSSANGGKHSNDSSGLHVIDGNSGANGNTGFAFMVSASALGLVPGETYVFSAELSSLSTNGESNGLQVFQHSSDSWWKGKRSNASWASGAGTYHVGFKYDGSAYVYLLFSVGVGGSATVTRFGLYHAASAAWAPAEGETLAGGGAQMSANLWNTSTENFKPDANGVYLVGKSTDELKCTIAGASALSANQTVHFGASLRGAGKGYLSPFVEYRNAVGNLNWVGFPHWTPTDQWQRFEATCVVPSGMTITKIGFNTSGATGDIEVMNPAWSYGSPVVLASSAHTPYATQDHVAAEYATKAALKVTSDAVTAEVTERGKLAGRVGTLESTSGTHTSKLEQLAASIKSLVKGESTYTDPNGQSATSGIYSLVTQTRDSVTALFGQYTKTDDLAATDAVKDAKKAGTDAQAAASAAQTTADSAKSTAQAAASDAATAKTNAASAVSTANSASTSAANAVETANAASSTASSASSTANSAASTANSAKSTADAAKTSAASAVSTANSASSTAGAAKSTADELATMVRQYSGGVLVGRVGQQVGALVNADGSFDVVDVTWNSGTPTVGKKLMCLAKNSIEFNNPDTSYNICNITANGTINGTITNIDVPNGSLAIDGIPAWCQALGDSGYDSFIAGKMLQLGAGNRTTYSEILIEPDGTTIDGYKFALGTNNTTDTWVPVMGGNSNAGHLVHRVINLKWGPNAYAVYCAYNPNNGGDHYYTTNVNEYNNLVKSGWTGSGVYFYAAL